MTAGARRGARVFAASVAFFLLACAAQAKSVSATAAPLPLFAKGVETFRIVDESGESPRFRLLEGSARKRAMAFAINAALRAMPNGDKAGPSSNSVEAKIEKMVLRPDPKDRSRLRIALYVSGHAVELRETLDREDFAAGRKIALRIRPKTEEAPPLTVESSGHLTMQWNRKADAIEIPRAAAHFTLSAPLADDEQESIEFQGKALRQR